jgi:hypothetical protein
MVRFSITSKLFFSPSICFYTSIPISSDREKHTVYVSIFSYRWLCLDVALPLSVGFPGLCLTVSIAPYLSSALTVSLDSSVNLSFSLSSEGGITVSQRIY